MAIVKIKCPECNGGKYLKNHNRQTGHTACFSCKGLGYVEQDMDDEEAAKLELMAMTKKALALVDCDKYKWQCHVEGCTKFTHVKDYGIAPLYYTRWGWLDLTGRYLSCFKHAQREDAGEVLPLKDGYGENHLIPLSTYGTNSSK